MDAIKLTRLRRLVESGHAKAIRQAAGLSLTEAASGAGIDRITIFRWERGDRRPHGEAALRYLAFLEEVSR